MDVADPRPRRLVAGAIGGGLGAVGLATHLGAPPDAVVDVACVLGALAGVFVRRRWARAPIAIVGVGVFLLRLVWVLPVLMVGVVTAAALALGLARLVPAPPPGRQHVVVAGGAAVVAGLVYTAFSVHRHLRFGSGSWDYGCYLHNAWLFAHGQAFSTHAVSSVLGDAAFWGGTNHFMPSLVFTAPLAWVMEATSSTSLLLVAQVAVVCGAVVPLAAVARRRGLPLLTTTAVALAFLFHTGVQAALLFDVHEVAPVPCLIFVILWIVETKQASARAVGAVVVLLLLLGGTKESALLYAAALSALLMLRPGWRLLGVVGVVFFAAAFVVVVGVVQPALLEPESKGMIHLARFGGGDAGGLLQNVLLHPGRTLVSLISPDVKLMSIGTAGAGFGFLALASGEALVLALPNLAERFLADKREMWGLGFHYGLVGAAFLSWGALDIVSRLRARLSAAVLPRFDVFASVLLLGSTLASSAFSPTPPDLATFDKPYYASADDIARYQRALALVADDTAVIAQNHFLPHLALREHIWLPERRFLARADVVVLDTAASPWPHDPHSVQRLVADLEHDPRFDVAFHEATTWVFVRRRSST